MDVLYERVAGLDIGKKSVAVCVRTPGPGGQRASEVRTFRTMTRSLQLMGDWLSECGVTLAAMESTSTYWKPAYYALEPRMECWLLNAAHIKALPGRKTDVRDAEWIATLVEHGLVRPSFVPPPDIRRLRMLTRYRVQLTGDRTRDAKRLEQMLEDASIKVSSVASSVTTKSVRLMLWALINGEADPQVLADLAQGKMRAKIPDLVEALTGSFDPDHARLGTAMLTRLDTVEANLKDLNATIAHSYAPWEHQIELLCTIPGVGVATAQVIIAETGGDMSRFPTPQQLAAWAGLAPGVHESAGVHHRAARRPGNKWLASALVEAAASAARTRDTYLGAQYRRIERRRGGKRALIAVAHSILVSTWYMLSRDEPYLDLGTEWLARRGTENDTRRLVAQLERLGHTVTLDAAS